MNDSARAAGAPPPKFVVGSTMRHVVEMTATASVGLLAIFLVDFLSLLYVSWLGDKASTAGVGFASVVFFFAMSVNIGLMIAVSALMSKALGAGDRPRARELGGAALALMVVLSTAMALAIMLLLPVLLPLLGAQGRVYDVAHRFLMIALPSTPLMALGMGWSSALRAIGDAKRAMNVTLSGGIATAIFDPLLIFGFHLGVDGAAIATIISRIIFAYVGYLGAVKLHDLIAQPTLDMVKRNARAVMKVAGPAILTNLAAPVAISFVTRVTAQFGESAIAASAIIDRVVPLAFGGVFALTGAIGPILGQNWGAKRFDRMRRAFLDALIFVAVYVIGVWIILVALREGLVHVFGVADLTADLVRFFALASGPIWLFMGFLFTANSAFNNLGFPLYATGFNWGRATLGTMPFALLGASLGGAQGVMVGFGCGAALFAIGSVWVAWRCIGRLEQQAPAVEASRLAA
ncbi:MATE family efflux transporter [Terrarubrum flagellatum]|uniref:MATE family efflux transporter n=1 Tax=Terrirubrum flagellatum TaxID=2895980 RepID=UPI0031455611